MEFFFIFRDGSSRPRAVNGGFEPPCVSGFDLAARLKSVCDEQMLRHQSDLKSKLSFLAGESEMSTRIREFDWRGHPLGQPEDWPDTLRTALSLSLNSTFPTSIYWGPDLRLLYNDAWSSIPGPRHPGCLGEPAREVWSDIWSVIEPQFIEVVQSGTGLFLEDQMLPMRRFGKPEETYWTYNFTPIRGADGAIEGIFNSGFETTDKVLARRHTEMLLAVSERLRRDEDLQEKTNAVCQIIGESLGAAGVGIRDSGGLDPSVDFRISSQWTEEGSDLVGESISVSSLGSIAEDLQKGKIVRIESIASAGSEEAGALLQALNAEAVLAIPHESLERLRAVSFVRRKAPYKWTDAEVTAVEQAFERTLWSIEKKKAEERERAMLREIDHRARNTLSVVRSIVRITTGDDVEDYRERLAERLAALANVHAVLAETRWTGTSVSSLLKQELAPYTSENDMKVAMEGEEVWLSAMASQPIAMIFHELATNAAKYGALSHIGGKIDVTWSSKDGFLDLTWAERGFNPAQTSIAQGTGFGENLLGFLVERLLRGRIRKDIGDDTFQVNLGIPLQSGKEQAPDQTAGDASTPERTTTRRLLVLEDNPMIAMDLSECLVDLGYHVTTTYSVSAALAAMDVSTLDGAILDVNLGHETSASVARRLLENDVPVLLLTGYTEEDVGEPVFEGLPMIQKPFNDSSIKAAIEDLLR